jgi:phosphoribosylanthranilate isomerase
MTRVKVKICGITNWRDAKRAIEGGADLLGFNFYARSPRYITPQKAREIARRLPKRTAAVGVFVNETEEAMLEIARTVGLEYLQLHGDKSPATVASVERSFGVIKAIQVGRAFRPAQLARFKRTTAILLDGFDGQKRGGTGRTFDWQIARKAKSHGRIFLAGGITPENVEEAIRAVRPYAVDVCSGVEAAPGKKHPARMKALLSVVKQGAGTRAKQPSKLAAKSPNKRKR